MVHRFIDSSSPPSSGVNLVLKRGGLGSAFENGGGISPLLKVISSQILISSFLCIIRYNNISWRPHDHSTIHHHKIWESRSPAHLGLTPYAVMSEYLWAMSICISVCLPTFILFGIYLISLFTDNLIKM